MADIPRVVLTGGVSGGHTFPLIAVSRALTVLYPEGIEFLFIGSNSKGGFESESMGEEGIPTRYVLTGKLRRYFSFQNFIDPFKVPIGIIQALWHLFRFLPNAVFAKGGSASVPVVIAAWLLRIPVLIHDSDAVAGRANRLLARFATRIAIAYPSAKKYFPEDKTALTGNPVRSEILSGNIERAKSRFDLSSDKPTLLVIGGSQGAKALNEATLRILPAALKENVQILHQTGEESYKDILASVSDQGIIPDGTSGYLPKPFFTADELADALVFSTLVLSRAGAGSISELAANKKAVILVPLASAANNEQRMNAYDIAEIGGALVLEEANLGEHILLRKIGELLNDETLRKSMGEKLSVFYHPEAAANIALGLQDLMEKK